MRMIAATVNPVHNLEMTVKKSESITKTDFKHELEQKMDSNKQETPIDNVQSSDSQVKNSVGKKDEDINKREQLVQDKTEKPVEVEKTQADNIKKIRNFKELQLESNFHEKNAKKTGKNRFDKKEFVKLKTGDQDSEQIQAAQLIQPQSNSEDIKLINREFSSPDKESKNVKLVKDINVKNTEQNDTKQVNAQNLMGEKVDKKSKNLHVTDKKETKAEDKKKSDSVVKVTDLRSTPVERNTEKEVNRQELTQNQSVSEVNLDVDEAAESSSERTIVLGTTEISAEGEGGKSQAPVMKEATSLLKQQLKDFGNSEIVKQSRFILKDNNVGEIKLILKPEALGEVKINLNLNENSLAGQIVVENSSVREVFQENLNSLSQALEKEGFDKADLNLSLSDKGQREEQQEREKNKQYFSERLKRFDDNGQVVRYGLPTAGINLTA